ncbi:hypothetical protein [Streptomyces sp. NPDC005209]|uniref:hypothetical protein n=1 Tax=Streptomyces sp. NPDC005209 TaxID=3156715 RepID=UPI0033B7DF21
MTGTANGTFLGASWRDGMVALWDIASGERADLDFGPGITTVHPDADLRLTVGGPSGHAVVQLDVDALWPARELMLRVVSFKNAACATDSDPNDVPRHLARLLSWDADDARRAYVELDTLLAPRRELSSAAVLHCHVRRPVLGLALRIIRALDTAEGHWLAAAREILAGIVPLLPDMLNEEDPVTRTAGALLIVALPERDEEANPLLRALATGDPDPEAAAAAALALGDATAVDALISVGWERTDVDAVLPGR